jgi:hypothetical protein
MINDIPPEIAMTVFGISFAIGGITPWLVINYLESKGKCCVHPQVKLFYSAILGVLLCIPAGAILWPIGLLVVTRKVLDPKQWKIPLLISLFGFLFTVSCVIILILVTHK